MRNVILKYIPLLFLLVLCDGAFAQIKKYIDEGNKFYDHEQYKDATENYLKALSKDSNNTAGLFNVGNSLYQLSKSNKTDQYDNSRKFMEMAANKTNDKVGKAAANYNIGNTYMEQRKWEDAAAAYKKTLRNNPQDVDAKYNLSYAEQMMKQQQQQQNKDKKNDKQDEKKQDQQQKQQDQKKDKDQEKKDEQNKQGDNDQQKPDDNKDNKDQKPQSQPSKLTQQQADQLLNALQQEEKKLQDKLKKVKGVPTKMDKDW